MKTVNLKIGTDTYESEGGKPETRDEYPWGLRFTLNNDTLEKAGDTTAKGWRITDNWRSG